VDHRRNRRIVVIIGVLHVLTLLAGSVSSALPVWHSVANGVLCSACTFAAAAATTVADDGCCPANADRPLRAATTFNDCRSCCVARAGESAARSEAIRSAAEFTALPASPPPAANVAAPLVSAHQPLVRSAFTGPGPRRLSHGLPGLRAPPASV